MDLSKLITRHGLLYSALNSYGTYLQGISFRSTPIPLNAIFTDQLSFNGVNDSQINKILMASMIHRSIKF